MADTPHVYAAINAVSATLAKEGISKSRKNDQQGYKFRGIDEVFNALAPALVEHKLVVLPRMMGRTVTERTTAKGGVLFYVIVEAEFDFVSAVDGSAHVVRTFGEAMDSGDKATNKAMSAAYKYAAFQAFCIPTEGDNDADQTTHEIAPKVPDGYQDWLMDLQSTADEGDAKLRKTWKESKKEYRDHLTATDKKALEVLAAKAKAVDEAKAAPSAS